MYYHDMTRSKSCSCEKADASISLHIKEAKQVTTSSSTITQAIASNAVISGTTL